MQRPESPYKEIAIAHFCKQMSVTEISQKEGKNLRPFRHSYIVQKHVEKMLAEKERLNAYQ